MTNLVESAFKPFASAKHLNGFLWIGDPHLSSHRIGRRKDNFMESCFTKLEFCKTYANTNMLRVALGGDLLDRKNENSVELIVRLNRWCRSLAETPVDIGSNHDLSLGVALDTNVLKLLSESEALHLLLEPGLLFKDTYTSLAGDEYTVAVFGTPYGYDLPDYVESDADVVILMTHHDLAMNNPYPKSIPLKEIQGVDLVINGHMHANKPTVRMGQTLWCNPGNIEPLSVDLKDMTPKAWQFDINYFLMHPEQPLMPVALPHAEDVFDLTGLQVSESSTQDVAQTLEVGSSYFSKALVETSELEAGKTDDASLLLQDLVDVSAEDTDAKLAAQLIFGILHEVLPEANLPTVLEWPDLVADDTIALEGLDAVEPAPEGEV